MLAIAALLAGRVFLGVGESFTATGATLWDQNRRRDPRHGLSLERRGDLCGDGGRGAAGSYPQSLFWHQRLCYGGSAGRGHRSAVRSYPPGRQGDRRRQSALSRGGAKIWPYGLGLAFGTVGFGVIATFITLYFAAHSWQGAAFTLSLFSVGFICVRLVLGNTITRFGGVPVSWPASSSKVSACCLSGWRHQHGWPASAPFSPVRVSRWSFRL